MTTGQGEQVVKLQKTVDGTTHTVYIMSAKVEENLTNPDLITIERAFIGNDQTTKGGGTLFIKLNRFKHAFDIQGYLSAEQGSGNEKHVTAKAVKDELIKNILYPQGDVEFHYRDYKDTDYSDYYGDNSTGAASSYVKVQPSKVSITEASTRADYMSGVECRAVRYNIELDLIRGKTK